MDKMSKVIKRKITVDSNSNNGSSSSSNNNGKESQKRQSVFERLGTKTVTPITVNTTSQSSASGETFCRHWAQNGSCPFGKTCKFVNTHVLISPSKRGLKKDSETKVGREDTKRLLSSVVKRERGSPEVNWDSWDQTDLEYEDEKALEKRRQLLQRELKQMKRDKKECSSVRHSVRSKHYSNKDKKPLSSCSSSSSVTSTSSTETSSSSDESSSASSSSDSKHRKIKSKKLKRDSSSSGSEVDRVPRKKSRNLRKEHSASPLLKKSRVSGNVKKRGGTPPLKGSRKTSSVTSRSHQKLSSPPRSISGHKRHAPSPPTHALASSKSKLSSKISSGSRHRDQSPKSSSRRSASPSDRKDKHYNRSISPKPVVRERERARSRTPKTKARERTPPPQPTRKVEPPRVRRKESPELKTQDKRVRKISPKRDYRLGEHRTEDRKKEEDRLRNKDDRRQDRKIPPERLASSDRDKRDLVEEATRAREKAREKERFEALERCRERQRERELLAKEKDKIKERGRDEKEIPSLLSMSTHNPDRKNDRDRLLKDRKDREKDRFDLKEKDRSYDRSLDKSLDKGRISDRFQDRDRLNDKNDRQRDKDRRGLERDHVGERRSDKPERDRSYDRERGGIDRERVYERGSERDRLAERNFEREKERNKIPDIKRERESEFERDRDRVHDKERERPYERERSYERSVSERDRVSLEKDRSIVRDRGLERVLERERNKSLEKGRGSDSERSLDRGRDRFDRDRYDSRRPNISDEKGYDSPYEEPIRRDRGRFPADSNDRGHYSPGREEHRNVRMQPFSEDRRRRDGRNWDFEDGPKGRDWDFPDNRREWDHNRLRRSGHSNDNIEVDPVAIKSESLEPDSGNSLKRSSPEDDGAPAILEIKKIKVEEPPKDILEEALSDISDDPDEILNMDDTEDVDEEEEQAEEEPSKMASESSATVRPRISSSGQSCSNNETLDQSRLTEDREADEDGVVNLDFEEISDDELEEEARHKGLGDALGVDWASLVAETRPKHTIRQGEGEPGAAHRRWEPTRILQRIGISLKYAGPEMYNKIQEVALENSKTEAEAEEEGELQETKPGLQLLNPIAGIHVTSRLRQAQRRVLFSGADTFKRALSARKDIAIRRQLCNLPVRSLEVQQTAGLCQWVV